LFTGKNSAPQGSLCDYRVYRLSRREWIRCFLEAAAAEAAMVYVFYRSLFLFMAVLPLAAVWPLFRRDSFRKKRQEILRVQFREGLMALSSALEAGYSVENAFGASVRDLTEMYGVDGMITVEFSAIALQMKMNRTPEALLADFGRRSGIEEIRNFAEIFAVAKRSRGGISSVIAHFARVISGKIQVREEILNMTAEKVFEQRIMNLIPFFIVIYVDVTSPGFFTVMYRTAAGRIVMTGCLALYAAALLLSRHFLNIEV
jgi:tight adherence protein B